MKKILLNINTTRLPIIRGEGYISGVGRSTQCLIDYFPKIIDKEIVVETCLEGWEYINSSCGDISLTNHRILLPYRFASFFRSRLLDYDIYHYPNNYFARTMKNEKYVLTVHDVIQYKRVLENGQGHIATAMKKNILNSCGVITCSSYTKKQIVDIFNCDDNKIDVIPWGVDLDVFRVLDIKEIKKRLEKIKVPDVFFLAVSCRDPRKNISTLLKAYKVYCQNGKIPLVLLWQNPPRFIFDEYAREISEGKIVFLNYVSDEELVALYNKALCTMFPSREEGFGFPIIESFACGTPVLTCNNSSLYEVGRDYAYYVKEDDVRDMVGVMALLEREGKNLLDKKVRDYVNGFSWYNTAASYIDYYKSL